MSAFFRVKVEAMITWRCGSTLSSSGSAVSPSITGISMSRMATSTSCRSMAFSAIWPLPTEAITWTCGSSSSMRVTRPRTTAESSTTMTRIGSLAGEVLGLAPFTLCMSGRRSEQSDLRELRLHDLAVERLHDVFVGAGRDGFLDVLDVVLSGAEHDDRLFPTRQLAQFAEEIDAVHVRHVPIQQDRVRQFFHADVESDLPVFRFLRFEAQLLQDFLGHHADDLRVVDNQTGLHSHPSLSVGRLAARPEETASDCFRPREVQQPGNIENDQELFFETVDSGAEFTPQRVQGRRVALEPGSRQAQHFADLVDAQRIKHALHV